MDLREYLTNSLNSDNKDLCKGWDYLKENITEDLKRILEKEEYWNLEYNSKKVDFILRELHEDLNEDLKRQLESFVYVRNRMRGEQRREQEEQELLDRGYYKIFGSQKELDNQKVKGIFKLSKIGLLGTFDKLEEKEGTLKYSERFNSLMLIPKRCRTRGYIIRDFAYIQKMA